MKKLMIAAAILCAAVTSQAAVTNWKFGAGNSGILYDGYKSVSSTYQKAALGAQTVYIIAAATDTTGVGISRTALVSAFKANKGSIDLSKYAVPASNSGANNIKTTSAGKITGTSNSITFGNGSADAGEFTGGQSYDFYFAALVTDGEKNYLYVGDIGKEAANSGTSQKSVTINGLQTSSQTFGVFDLEAKTYSAGWYAYSSDVPEPTSAMLMLLGFAGLALRRKQK